MLKVNKNKIVEEALKVTRTHLNVVPGTFLSDRMPGWNGPSVNKLIALPVDEYDYPISTPDGAPFRANNVKHKSGYQPIPKENAEYAEDVFLDGVLIYEDTDDSEDHVKFVRRLDTYGLKKHIKSLTDFQHGMTPAAREYAAKSGDISGTKAKFKKYHANAVKELEARESNPNHPGHANDTSAFFANTPNDNLLMRHQAAKREVSNNLTNIDNAQHTHNIVAAKERAGEDYPVDTAHTSMMLNHYKNLHKHFSDNETHIHTEVRRRGLDELPHINEESNKAIEKKIHKGDDIGKPGKHFKQIAEKAAKRYGSKEAGERVAAAVMWKNLHKEEVFTGDNSNAAHTYHQYASHNRQKKFNALHNHDSQVAANYLTSAKNHNIAAEAIAKGAPEAHDYSLNAHHFDYEHNMINEDTLQESSYSRYATNDKIEATPTDAASAAVIGLKYSKLSRNTENPEQAADYKDYARRFYDTATRIKHKHTVARARLASEEVNITEDGNTIEVNSIRKALQYTIDNEPNGADIEVPTGGEITITPFAAQQLLALYPEDRFSDQELLDQLQEAVSTIYEVYGRDAVIDEDEDSDVMYHVIDKKTGLTVGKYKSKNRARNVQDRKDNEYGSYNHFIKAVKASPQGNVVSEDEDEDETYDHHDLAAIHKERSDKLKKAGEAEESSAHFHAMQLHARAAKLKTPEASKKANDYTSKNQLLSIKASL